MGVRKKRDDDGISDDELAALIELVEEDVFGIYPCYNCGDEIAKFRTGPTYITCFGEALWVCPQCNRMNTEEALYISEIERRESKEDQHRDR